MTDHHRRSWDHVALETKAPLPSRDRTATLERYAMRGSDAKTQEMWS